jgi:hypothetical protein
MNSMPGKNDEFSEEETAKRRDAVLKIMVNTPPQPRATHPPGQPKKRKPTGEGRAPKASDRPQKP